MGIDPVSMAVMGLTAAGTGMKVFGSLRQGNANAAAYNYQAQVAEFNKQMAEREGVIDSHTMGLKTRAKGGEIKARQAASGVDVNTGSNVEVQAANRQLGMLDVLTIRSNAARRAFGYRLNKEQALAASKNAKTAGRIDAVTSLLSGAKSIVGGFSGLMPTGSKGTSFVGNEMSVGFDSSSPLSVGGGRGTYETYELL